MMAGALLFVLTHRPVADDGSGHQAAAAAVTEELSRAREAQGICYGWQLLDEQTVVSAGSSLGLGVRAEEHPDRCPRWIEVRGTYHDYPDDEEGFQDYAGYAIVTSTGITKRLDPAGFDGAGAGANRPRETILDAAEALPMLAVEAGVTSIVAPQRAAAGTPRPLPEAGNDFLRYRWVLLVIGGAFLVAAGGTTVLLRWLARLW
ncbi:hypothetical protein [Dactylosporangium matsuzakiense]|nr:hypothetical protein [Dactylosporangium matsuzakiense]